MNKIEKQFYTLNKEIFIIYYYYYTIKDIDVIFLFKIKDHKKNNFGPNYTFNFMKIKSTYF